MATEIKNENEVIIDGQYIGRLKGMKLELDLKSGSLKNDIKSLRKAARQAIAPELMRRANKIIKSDVLRLEDDHKIYWSEYPIAYLTPGQNYLNPKLELIVDEAIDQDSKEKLKTNLESKLSSLIRTEPVSYTHLTLPTKRIV